MGLDVMTDSVIGVYCTHVKTYISADVRACYQLLLRPQKAIWHGAHASGERAMDAFCDEWQSDDPGEWGMAASLHSHKLLSQER